MYYAIIVAGGSGSRMNSELPKQFMIIAGQPVLMHTLYAFLDAGHSPEVILVLHPAFHDLWKELCHTYSFNRPVTVVNGGATRFESVQNALRTIHHESVIAIHDAVRPVISSKIIALAYTTAERSGSAVAAIASRDSVRLCKGPGLTSSSLNRDTIFLVQTPQTFRSQLLKDAYQLPYDPAFTDDAAVVEAAGHSICLIEGESRNIKITLPEDLLMAELLLKQKNLAG